MRLTFIPWVTYALAFFFYAYPQNGYGSNFLATMTGFLLETTIHESGHAATAVAYGWTLDEFKPYPHICGGRLVGGCVHAHTDDGPYLADGSMNKQYLRESRAIAAAGSLASQLSVLILSPLVAKTSSSRFFGQALRTMLYLQNLDWLFYVATDTLTDFKGDWYSVAQSNNVPTAYYLPPAALSYWALNRYRQSFLKPERGVSSPIIRPRYAFLGHKTPQIGVDFMWTLN